MVISLGKIIYLISLLLKVRKYSYNTNPIIKFIYF